MMSGNRAESRRPRVRRTWVRGLVTLTAGLSAVLSLSGAATASGAPAGFTAQARALGLTGAETAALQSRADAYVASTGGTRTAVDRIRLADGAVLTLALPGRAAASCGYGHFCAYSGVNWTGDVIDMYRCAEYQIPWSGNGSWINNQTTGTRAQFKSSDHVTRWTDSGAYTTDDVADWGWVWYVKNC